MEEFTMRGHHDIGGLPSGTIESSEHDIALWEKQVDAIEALLSKMNPPLVRDDELRRGIENLDADDYEKLDYYERWIVVIRHILLEKNLFTVDDLEQKIREISSRFDPKSYL
ncbi:MAG: nitrile hydratase subunit beta [Microcystis wesenbergii TW10]|jgi:hypothetical protein|uniref:Nitrile hydratase subunit beta n=4 Tax=Microcystis TaxID=1125 RepID=A0A552A952_MICAE|nr:MULTISPECIES: SH3-like domain-containing protein [Microcystis]MCZ8105923.1 nitrile hydratase subunit beta [Burkholderiales bacterium]REJ52480.1 MAG: nitrile hydratase subunit beta [Microcystis wesenbergii TW10]TRT82006.1 MAG: nitrile hydratase subunit beta [Microcystis aeruginosa Ma_OC_H_19870700_S124]MBD2117496.1 nitrile hydratase subunit beta [Microcystis wesenbergii FACHB-1339]MCZ8038706.1 nitrile hydratase subunit beta [Microcystis sp. LE17-20A]